MCSASTSVSILVPVYNVKDYVCRCLESIAAQTYQGPMECIVVDDCGNDDSMVLVKKFVTNYSGRIDFRVLRHERNRGLAAARNTAVANAKYDFVFHLDSDDWLESTAIEHLVKKQKETNADIVSGNALRHGINRTAVLKEFDYASPLDMVHRMIEMTIGHVIWRRLIRRSLYSDNEIEAIEGVNVGEDHHTMPRLAYYAKKVATLDEIVYHYNCINPNSYMSVRTSHFNMKRFRSDYSSIKILQDFFKDKDEYCTKRLQEIESEFLENSMKNAAMHNDISAYKEISAQSIIKPPVFLYWKYYGRYVDLRILLIRLAKKVLKR